MQLKSDSEYKHIINRLQNTEDEKARKYWRDQKKKMISFEKFQKSKYRKTEWVFLHYVKCDAQKQPKLHVKGFKKFKLEAEKLSF